MICQFCKTAERELGESCPNSYCPAHHGVGTIMPSIQQIQSDAAKWHSHNFGPTQQHQCIYGMMEELGELACAILKQEQGIRAVNADDVKDAIGDLMIFTMQLCNHLNLNLYNIIYETWQKVRQRDWKKFPINGVDK